MLMLGSRKAVARAVLVVAAAGTLVASEAAASIATPAAAAAAAPSIIDVGTSVLPVAVNANQQVVSYNGSVWRNGTLTTAQAPSSDPTATFDVASDQDGTQINDSGVVVGDAVTGGVTVPAYWNTASSTFTVVSLAGLTVNSQPATGGFFEAVDAAGDAVGVVYNSAGNAGGVSANTAGLFVAGNNAMPTGASQVLASVGGTAIHSLDGVSAGYEDANASQSDVYPEVLINRQNQTATTTNLYPTEGGPIGFADNGTLSGATGSPNLTPTVRTPSGSETSLSEPTGDSGPATDVNASGTVVGFVYSESGPAVETGLLWSSNGTDSALLSLTSDPGGWSGLQPEAINDTGYVVGTGYLNGAEHGFLISTARIVPPVVTSSGDAPAANPLSGSCDTGQTVANALGQQVPECTLRAAIQTVNAIGTSGQQITFDIPQHNLAAIALTSALPAITAAGTTVDATTEAGGSIGLDGTKLGGAGSCLIARAAGIVIRGFDLANCPTGVELAAPGQDKVQGDVIGLAADGTTAAPGTDGVIADFGSSGNLIGGSDATDRDVISAQSASVTLDGSDNTVQGDLLGTDVTGKVFVPDQLGVVVESSGDIIGGSTKAVGEPPGNVMVVGSPTSRFDFGVVTIGGSTTVAGNLIGTDVTGTVAYAPKTGFVARAGVLVAGPASGDVIGGAPGAGNVIAGAERAQVELDGAGAVNSRVVGNRIGAGATGDVIASPTAAGVLDAGAAGADIGDSGEANTITGQKDGIVINKESDEIDFTVSNVVDGKTEYETYALPGTDTPAKTTAAVVKDNVIGPLPGGETVPTTTQEVGVLDTGGQHDTIGPRNVISFNVVGVELDGTLESGTEGNLIGTDAGGLDALPNGVGIKVKDGSNRTVIGVTGTPDTISGNLLGVDLDSGGTLVHGEIVGPSSRGDALLKEFHGTLPASIRDATAHLADGGILLDTHAGATIIGGVDRGEEVTVAGTDGTGIIVRSTPAIMVRDRIGVAVRSRTALPNKGDGLEVDTDGKEPALFGVGIIAHSGRVGVLVDGRRDAMVVATPIYDNADGGLEIRAGDVPHEPKVLRAVNELVHHDPRTVITTELTVPRGDFGQLEVYATPSCERHGGGEKGLAIETRVRGGARREIKVDVPTEPVGTAITALLTVTPGNDLAEQLDERDKPHGVTSKFSECVGVKASK
jgi:hypothetical protein